MIMNQSRLKMIYLETVLNREADTDQSLLEKSYAKKLRRLTKLRETSTYEKVRILDLGCGTGRFSIYLAKYGFDVFGIDIWPDFVRIARDKANESQTTGIVNFVVGRSEELPHKSNLFDMIMVLDVLEHVCDWQKTLSEIARVTKSGGIVLIETTNKMCPFQNEINKFPFFPYLPDKVKQKMIDIIMKKYRHLVNYTFHPARNWFTYHGLQKYLLSIGFIKVYGILDLIDPGSKGSLLLRALSRFPPLKWILYFLSKDTIVYAQK